LRFSSADLVIENAFGANRETRRAPPADAGAAEREERLVDVGATVPPDAQASEAVQPRERALDDPAVDAEPAAMPGAALGDERPDAASAKFATVRLGVVAAVGVQGEGTPSWSASASAHGGCDALLFLLPPLIVHVEVTADRGLERLRAVVHASPGLRICPAQRSAARSTSDKIRGTRSRARLSGGQGLRLGVPRRLRPSGAWSDIYDASPIGSGSRAA
jgi:hypothetical protein